MPFGKLSPDEAARMAAGTALSRLVDSLIEYMIEAGEDPTDTALWERRKAQAIGLLQARLVDIGRKGDLAVTLSPEERAKVERARLDERLQTSPCRVSGESAMDSPGQAR